MDTRLSLNDGGWVGWKEQDNSQMIHYKEQGYKHPSDMKWNHQFKNNPVYGRNYFLVYPCGLDKLPRNDFKFNTPIPYAFQDAWIKP